MIYSQPKAGKTTISAQLPKNLIVDMDPLGGADFVKALRVPARTVDDLRGIINALFNAPRGTYDYITLDPLTDLENIVLPLACQLYQVTPMGKGWTPFNPETGTEDPSMILSLPKGGGYQYHRDAFFKIVHNFAEAARQMDARLILSAHVRDKYITKEGKDVEAVDINLTGKLRSLVAGWVDAIGYLKREGEEAYLTFETSDAVLCGSRIEHLADQKILISKKVNGSVETYWDRIYLPED